VVNFWASWCGPCTTEMPHLESAFRAGGGRIRFLGIDSGDTRGAAIAFLASVHATYPTVFDPSERAASAYGLFGLPTTVFVSPQGKVLGRHFGQLDTASLQAALREAFGRS
jgi:cytochrome c biogenesis protein CcmG, thiol:disulfide interchange protein DsbE